ncbi:MAG: nucleotidyl transferase AbiEii/AbiGii toxin family protein [Desulfobacterales bacterium]|nr:nucleotidyl transferase AbiEii/AbiGii toxin family protein [Desulfobacterales bacterium]
MNPSREYLQACSIETGYQIAPLEKVVRLGEMAGDITRHPFLGKVLALKGGTALNLCFGPPKRLSVDLDYNYIGNLEREKMLEDRPRVEEAIYELGRRRGYQPQRSAESHAGRKIFLTYRSVIGHDDRIEVDLNYIFRPPLVQREVRELWQPGELDRVRALVVGLEELLAGKLIALLDRSAARDVWDVANLSAEAIEVVRSRPFRNRFIALSAILDHPLHTYTKERLKGILTERAISDNLAPMLSSAEPLEPGEIIDRAWALMDQLLLLAPNEKEYVEGILRGEVLPNLLFDAASEDAKVISEHPAIQWKVHNVRRHLKRQSR